MLEGIVYIWQLCGDLTSLQAMNGIYLHHYGNIFIKGPVLKI